MQNAKIVLYLFLVLLSSGACTTSRWVVEEPNAIDRTDYEILDQHKFLSVSDSLSPQNPVLTLNLKSHTTYKYAQKTLVQRNIQDYKLRPGFVILGLAGAAASFYSANSGTFNNSSSSSLALNGVGALLTATSFLNLKPKGKPRPVGEKRYLNKTGSVVITDTVNIQQDEPIPTDILVTYRGKTVFEDNPKKLSKGILNIPLGPKLNDLQLRGEDPGYFDVKVQFNDSTYQYHHSISSVLQPYAQITSNMTSLRRRPTADPENVLADLAMGSQIKIERILNDEWFKVKYGNFENYIPKKDAEIVWRTANFSQQTKVIAVPRVPFGNIDVESNIPVLRAPQSNAYALIITNENYSADRSTRRHTHRDGKLMSTYLTDALGYLPHHIFRLTDLSDSIKIKQLIQKIGAASNDSTELFVYLGGYGSLSHDKQLQMDLISAGEEQKTTDHFRLDTFFNEIASIAWAKALLIADVDFSHSNASQLSNKEKRTVIEKSVAGLTDDATFIFGSAIGEPSRLYQSASGEDKKHHIFPYFLAKALQQGRTDVSAIYKLLEQNISYTSRRLHDRPQSPLIFGNYSFSFIAD